jgi:hypothetical protein
MNSTTISRLPLFDPLALLRRQDERMARADIVPDIAVAVGCAMLFASLGFLSLLVDIPLPSFAAKLPMLGLLALLTAGYCSVRFSASIGTTAGFCLAMGLGNLLGAKAGYLVYAASKPFPLIDSELYQADQWLGFDWLTMLHWFEHHPLLVSLTRLAYDQAGSQVILALPILLLAGQNRRLMMLVAAGLLALTLVHLIAIFLPAIGAYGYLGLTPADHPGVILSSEGRTVAHVLGLRGAAPFDPSRIGTMGLITFPSFHTVLAVHAAWAFWRIPMLRWLAIVFNVLVWLGTLLHGSHHLTDTIAGAAVAVVSIASVYFLSDALRARLYPENRVKVSG